MDKTSFFKESHSQDSFGACESWDVDKFESASHAS